jgi:prevent-host-death family protein
VKKVTATDLKQQLSKTLEAAQHEPIFVEKNGRPYAVILHPEEYEWYQKLEDRYWGEKAVAATASGDYVDGAELLREFGLLKDEAA